MYIYNFSSQGAKTLYCVWWLSGQQDPEPQTKLKQTI